MVTYNNFMLDLLRYLYNVLHEQCLVGKIIISESYIRQKQIFEYKGYETHHPSGGMFFFGYFSFQELKSGLISINVMFSTCLSVMYHFHIIIS